MLADFFGLFAFFVVALFRVFFAARATLLNVVVEAAVANFDLVTLVLDLPVAAFFAGAALFLGLFAFAADFGLADAFDLGLAARAGLAFLAPVDAFFLLALAAAGVAGGAEAAALVVGLLFVGAATVAVFLADAFFAGEADRFRLVPALAAFGLLDDRACFVPLPVRFLLPPGVFDRLLGLALVDFFVADAFFFVPPEEAIFVAADNAASLKLPLAPTPLVCFNVLFFVPARKAALRCWLTVA